jgi:hypothetical protein
MTDSATPDTLNKKTTLGELIGISIYFGIPLINIFIGVVFIFRYLGFASSSGLGKLIKIPVMFILFWVFCYGPVAYCGQQPGASDVGSNMIPIGFALNFIGSFLFVKFILKPFGALSAWNGYRAY